MMKRVAAHTVSITIIALYLLLILGAPFCALYHVADHHSGHGANQHASVCSWAHSSCASASLPSHESGATTLQPSAVLLIAAHEVASELDLKDHPARSPPVFLS
jgi:hypothetical protein